jgi:3-methylcrotonyl-CoA carboxylase alpha subunit
MFDKILIANRGEIACRVAATARRLGVRTVAVYSDPDSAARHVAACDEAVRIGTAPARDSYLHAYRIVAAALACGARAVHPGYGFLSENEDFALACAAAGLVFIGPPPQAIRLMGNKSEAKSLMQRAGVPVLPGYHGDDQEAAHLKAHADAIGYPVLIKAASGGGGKGMRVVESGDRFDGALASCRRESAAAFGDDRVLIERYLRGPRHIEIQVFADGRANCVFLFERDCSVQRRHQKVIEEAPAPGIGSEQRRAMGEAAVAAALAVGYVGAGTVEFIVDRDGAFYFMEMNTRLQVEHPVTEMITGYDLVEWQLRVAAGESLPVSQPELRLRGHAIEARVYAENPERDFMPSTGRIAHLALPAHVAFERGRDGDGPAPIRIDSGVGPGDEITPHYDPMIAKLIAWGATRDQALARLRRALAGFHLVGVMNNVDFLARLAENPAFVAGDLDTGLIERQRAALFAEDAEPAPEMLAAACARLLADEAASQSADPWSHRNGWRLNSGYRRVLSLDAGDGTRKIEIDYLRNGYELHLPGAATPLHIDAAAASELRLRFGAQSLRADVIRRGDSLHVFMGGRHRVFTLLDPIAHAGEHAAGDRSLAAPMPGKVTAIHTAVGARVEKGVPLLVLEAMKMEHTIVAPAAGTVEQLHYGVGEQVAEGALLASLKFD